MGGVALSTLENVYAAQDWHNQHAQCTSHNQNQQVWRNIPKTAASTNALNLNTMDCAASADTCAHYLQMSIAVAANKDVPTTANSSFQTQNSQIVSQSSMPTGSSGDSGIVSGPSQSGSTSSMLNNTASAVSNTAQQWSKRISNFLLGSLCIFLCYYLIYIG